MAFLAPLLPALLPYALDKITKFIGNTSDKLYKGESIGKSLLGGLSTTFGSKTLKHGGSTPATLAQELKSAEKSPLAKMAVGILNKDAISNRKEPLLDSELNDLVEDVVNDSLLSNDDAMKIESLVERSKASRNPKPPIYYLSKAEKYDIDPISKVKALKGLKAIETEIKSEGKKEVPKLLYKYKNYFEDMPSKSKSKKKVEQ
jgi:hypothetical protein